MDLLVRFRAVVLWIKKNPIYGFIGVLGSFLGVVAGIPAAWNAVTTLTDLPACGSYSKIYSYYDGDFRNEGQNWIERNPTETINFKELHRDRNYIVLLNQTPRTDPRWRSMLVRLPTCGGAAQWTYENPEYWIDLFQVHR
jgi:hypothetical protein